MTEKLGFEELRAKYKDVLSKAFATNNIDLLDSFSKTANEADRKAAMDQAFRDKLLDLLVEDPDTLENYVCFCIESCRRQMVTPTMPVVLLGDIFDALTLNKCEKMFTYVENGVNIWKEELFFGACKNNLLRMCNDLLRRLSRSQNTVFCGRILLFLAKFFPFSERSGLNIVSEFNLENVTEFGGDSSSTLKDSLDEEMVVDNEKGKLTIDYNLYCKFWSLQDFFRNPNTCYNKLQWKTFVAHSGNVLSAFSSYKLEAVELQKSKLNRLKAVSTDIEMKDSESKEQHYFAKFLTNQKLLELQLSDSNFRRCVLIQFLILFQYLTSTVKFKMESQELKSDQIEWLNQTTQLIYRLLGETPPDGKRFAECVKHILKREEHWNSWKNDGCPEFQKPKPPPVTDSEEGSRRRKRRRPVGDIIKEYEAQGKVYMGKQSVHGKVSIHFTEFQKPKPPPVTDSEEGSRRRKRRRPVGDIIKEYEAQGKVYMGNNELTKLWNLCPDNLAACRTKERDFMPSLETYMLTGADGNKRTSDGGWGWRALRLLARRSPHFFVHTNNPIGKLPDYLDDMVKRVSREVAVKQEANNTNGDASNNATDKLPKQEPGDEEMSEEQMEADLIKEGDTADIEQVPDSTHAGEDDYDKSSRARVTALTPAQIEAVAGKLEDWKKLAAKLGYKPDEIQYFETENATDALRAKNMLQLWCDDDEDASVENLLYILEGLKMADACEVLKTGK
ncbi:THO complex subunit 1 transcription elongation factor domain-containing protein [Phthorimaea operculella]|nr:THO complex subunit 1 transcription elongation factor domain-containing protein [Phthorimaea operculella]